MDHSYHRVTGSSRFFAELLREHHEVVALESHAWRSEPPITAEQVDAEHGDLVVFWQTLPWPEDLLRLRTPAVWVPMFDTSARRAGRSFWSVVRASGVRVLSFCQALSGTILRQRIPVVSCTYYPEVPPEPAAPVGDGLRVFLWDRGEIGVHHLRALLGEQEVAETVLRLNPDPGLTAVRPSSEDIRRFRIRLVEGPLAREEYLRLVGGCDVFVAPRHLEGIGLATLEAMALGLAVVAPDRPTMNEYIVDGENGYLYDPHRPRAIDLADARVIGLRARRDVEAGHARWLEERRRVLAALLAPFPQRRTVAWRTTTEARALTLVERAKSRIPDRPRAMAARALRSYRP